MWKNGSTQSKRAEGFTLLEVITVIMILGILTGVGTAGYTGYVQKACKSDDLWVIGQVRQTLEIGKLTGAISGGGAVVLHQKSVPTMVGDGVEAAMRDAFGENLGALSLQYGGWDCSSYADCPIAAEHYWQSAFGNPAETEASHGLDSLLHALEAVTDTAVAEGSDAFWGMASHAMDSYLEHTGLGALRDDGELTSEDQKKAANVAVAFVAQDTLDTLSGGVTTEQIADFIREQVSFSANSPQNAMTLPYDVILGMAQNESLFHHHDPHNPDRGEEKLLTSACLFYGITEAYCRRNSGEDTMELLHTQAEDLNQMYENLFLAITATDQDPYHAFCKFMDYVNSPELQADLDGYVAAMKAVRAAAGAETDAARLSEKHLYTTPDHLHMAEGYLELGKGMDSASGSPGMEIPVDPTGVTVFLRKNGAVGIIPFQVH